MKTHKSFTIFAAIAFAPFVNICVADAEESMPTVGIIGTGDMGDSLGPRFAELGGRSPVGRGIKHACERVSFAPHFHEISGL